VFRAYSERAKNIFNFLAALQSGAKEHADKRKIKARIRGQNFLWGSKGGSAPLKEKTAHMECTDKHLMDP
jgi:hypothetical protein